MYPPKDFIWKKNLKFRVHKIQVWGEPQGKCLDNKKKASDIIPPIRFPLKKNLKFSPQKKFEIQGTQNPGLEEESQGKCLHNKKKHHIYIPPYLLILKTKLFFCNKTNRRALTYLSSIGKDYCSQNPVSQNLQSSKIKNIVEKILSLQILCYGLFGKF